MKLFFSKILFFSIAISFWHAQLNSQVIFKHNETLSGLSALAENNGVSVADYDGDLDLDLFVVSVWKDEEGKESTHSKLYRNNGNGTFTDVTKGSGLENLLPFDEVSASYENFLGLEGFKNGAFWGDYDNDGYPDIFSHIYQECNYLEIKEMELSLMLLMHQVLLVKTNAKIWVLFGLILIMIVI